MTVIVSALYNVPSKFSQDQYLKWAIPFVRKAPTRTVIQCEKETQDHLKPHANHQVVFVILSIQEFVSVEKYDDMFLKAFHRHPEASIMKSHRLGQIWQEKKEFVRRAIDLLPNELHFIWCDIGILRDESCVRAYTNFGTRLPAMSKTFHILQLRDSPQIDNAMQNQKHTEYYFGGGILGAHRDVWTFLSPVYDSTMHAMHTLGFDIVKDQSVWINIIAKEPSMFTKHSPKEAPNVKDPWFSMLGIL